MEPLLRPVAMTLTEIPSGAEENSKQLIMCSQVTSPINRPFTVQSFITLPSSIVLSTEIQFTEKEGNWENISQDNTYQDIQCTTHHMQWLSHNIS